jgi:hypothetical protein
MNGYLVEITSADEDQFLKEQAVSLNIHNNIGNIICFFMGGGDWMLGLGMELLEIAHSAKRVLMNQRLSSQ